MAAHIWHWGDAVYFHCPNRNVGAVLGASQHLHVHKALGTTILVAIGPGKVCRADFGRSLVDVKDLEPWNITVEDRLLRGLFEFSPEHRLGNYRRRSKLVEYIIGTARNWIKQKEIWLEWSGRCQKWETERQWGILQNGGVSGKVYKKGLRRTLLKEEGTER